MKTVAILGSGCSKCKLLEQRLQDLKATHALDINVVKVTDLEQIIAHGVMMTPGLVVDGQLKSVGTVPKESQLLEWLKE